MTTRQKSSAPPPASITLRDIYYVLFRHKWLTIALVVLGVGGSLAVYEEYPFPYISEAKLYIRYIQETSAPQMEGNANVKSPDDRGANILNTEMEMLTSLDTARAVAREIGPSNILGLTLPTNASSLYEANAAYAIKDNLKAEVPPKSDVILLHYSASNPELARQVLDALIRAYKSNYVSIHLSMGFADNYLDQETDKSKAELKTSMEALEAEKTKVGITSVQDSKKNVTDMMYKTQETIYQLLAEMAETEAIIKDLQAQSAATMPSAPATNSLTNLAAAPPPPSADVVDKYRSLNSNLAALRAEEQKWMSQLAPGSTRMQNLKEQRMAAEAKIAEYEAENPGLVAIKSSVAAGASSPSSPSADPAVALQFNQHKQHALMARYHELTNQQALVQAQAIRLNVAEDAITKAETDREVADAKYKHFKTSLEQSLIDAGSKASNITTAEQPTPGGHDGKKMLKMAGGVLGFFLALAFGLPFFIEMVLDQSFKHSMDVKARIGAPFFITIPKTNGHAKLALKRAKPVALLSAQGTAPATPGTENGAVSQATKSEVAAWDERHELRPFFEALRDRLMTYFEVINLTHKPKLVAVTSCNEGAGVTTTAAGLASSLSETGEGNVLLVNMNVRDGEAHHFYKGKMDCGIEQVLAKEKRDNAQVQDHLYVVKETGTGDNLPRVLPKRFSHLVPLMKASDYDYIIFDMPPVSEISITPRLARYMDMVLLVIESEKTSREAGTRAAALLEESKTNVGLVLNKNRSYLPKRLQNI